MTFGHDESWYTSSGNSTGHSKSSLVDVTLFVPSSPGLQWGEHSTASAHVSKSGLTTSVGSATSYSRNTGNSSTGTPRFGTGLFTGNLLDTMSLSGVLAQVGVHKVDDVVTDGSLEDGRRGYLAN